MNTPISLPATSVVSSNVAEMKPIVCDATTL
jgi:hypothetical protein